MAADDWEELKLRIASQFDPVDLLDLLSFTMYDLVEALKEQIEESREELERELR